MHSNSLVLGTLIGGLSIGALYLALRSSPDANAAGPGSDIRLAALEAAVTSSSETQQALASELQELSGRIDNLGSQVARQPLSVPADSAPPGAERRQAVDRAAIATATGEVSPEEFRSLMSGLVRMTQEGSISAEDQQRFWEAARTTTMVDDTIEHLEAQVAEYPGDQAARIVFANISAGFVLSFLAPATGLIAGANVPIIWGLVYANMAFMMGVAYSRDFMISGVFIFVGALLAILMPAYNGYILGPFMGLGMIVPGLRAEARVRRLLSSDPIPEPS